MSTLVIDTIQGKTTAGSINVRGEGSNNTNLQQGLIKVWINLNGTGTIATRDSLNISGTTDNGTGDYTINISSAMGNTSYALATNGKQEDTNNFESSGLLTAARLVSSSSYRQGCRQSHYETNSSRDFVITDSVVLGDLA